MIQEITLGTIATALAFIVALWGSISFLANKVEEGLKASFKKELSPLSDKLDVIESKLRSVDMEQTKNFLVARFNEIGQGQAIDELTRKRIYDMMTHYEKDLDGNSYIHTRFEQLKKEGKL